MKVVSSGFGRPLPWLIVLLCLAGGVLATENDWLTSIRIGPLGLTNWFTELGGEEPAEEIVVPAEEIVVAVEPAKAPEINYATNPWRNTALFSPAATGWTLDASKAVSPVMKTQLVSTSPVASALPTASFSSGFILYSAGVFGPVPNSTTASGTWISNVSGVWSNAANWQGGAVADGFGETASFDTVNLTSDITVTLDSSRSIANLFIGDTDGTHRYTLDASGGSSLTFDYPGDFAELGQTSTSAGATINVPILLQSTLDINNYSIDQEFRIHGSIASVHDAPIALSFNREQDTGPLPTQIRVTGSITTGGNTYVQVLGGTVIFTGTNTYTGSTAVYNGTLLINGNNSGAPGTVGVGSGGTLGGTGTVGGSVEVVDGTITGGTLGTVGTLTLMSSVNLSTGVGSGTYVANIFGNTSDLLAITQTLTLGTVNGSDSNLIVSGTLDGITTYTIATFGGLAGGFQFGSVAGVPGNYELVYHDHDIQLVPVPIPEPATWIGGALAFGGIAFASRRRLRRAVP